MKPELVFAVVVLYFLVLIVIARFTRGKADVQGFFNANKQAPWYVVAFGMIGASLSGVTFISVPGAVYGNQFAYFQMVLGYLVGYSVIGLVLLPLYYRLNLISIYGYLEQRFGFWSYKVGASFFILSRVIGASFRLFLAAMVLHIGIFQAWGLPFALTTSLSILLIWVYTNQGGIRTIIWTDTLQTLSLLLAAIVSVWLMKNELEWTWGELSQAISSSEYSQIWFSGWWSEPKSFVKQFVSGALIALVMTGLDQDMMQKNLTCRNLGDAQKNMFWFSVVLVIVNFIFLSLGAMLFIYAEQQGIILPQQAGVILTDRVYPFLAFQHFGIVAGVTFLIGIIAAAYSSADSALTSLTTSFCVDILGIERYESKQQRKVLRRVHIGFSLLLVLVILVFKFIKDLYPESNVVDSLFKVAGYTYGPLLGLFAFGLFTKWQVKDRFVPIVCLVAPLICYILNENSQEWLSGYQFAYELLALNGLLTFVGLFLLRRSKKSLRDN